MIVGKYYLCWYMCLESGGYIPIRLLEKEKKVDAPNQRVFEFELWCLEN